MPGGSKSARFHLPPIIDVVKGSPMDDLAAHISLLAAPIFAALLRHGSVADLEDPEWQKKARAAAIRQAKLLWEDV